MPLDPSPVLSFWLQPKLLDSEPTSLEYSDVKERMQSV